MYYLNEKGERVYTLKVRGRGRTRARARDETYAEGRETDEDGFPERRRPRPTVSRRCRRIRRDSRLMISFQSSASR